ncbi:ABC transporter ATP-binding protein [Lutimonas zeaxanthinifaciens]|uniref:ABC transporter ATP-binding protein n=1 Tax=Lutimonas zeaxanthinifaciens TaxID=3060215 RepID=UPI00265D34D3|nr:ABC transporter ATP-binding protein [Lutimonas sp. YSD2104]WKK65551.1 ABC transporter ATP-binding protein [Lutimonas sp. YSD2104]
MIEISNLNKKFGKLTVLDGMDLHIDSGGIFAVLGPNGSGKTTLIKSILGMVIPDKGEIKIDGDSVLGEWKYRNDINYLPQIANFPANLNVRELIKMVKNLRPKVASDEGLIKRFGLESFLDKKLGNLSGGTKQKVNILLTFMFESDLIILDEPTTGLDPISLIHLKEIIHEEKSKGKTILITTHIMSFVEEIADEIVFLLDGEIYFKGSSNELKQKTNQKDLEHAIAKLISKDL